MIGSAVSCAGILECVRLAAALDLAPDSPKLQNRRAREIELFRQRFRRIFPMMLDNVIDDPLNIARKDAGLFEKISNFPIPVIDATRLAIALQESRSAQVSARKLLLQIGNFPAQFRQRVKWIGRRSGVSGKCARTSICGFFQLSDAVRFQFADVEDHRFRTELRANLRDRFRSRIRDERVNFHSARRYS